ncbi:MAG: hypothetical protein AAGK22_08920 [Acidobacteriota bacterium]
MIDRTTLGCFALLLFSTAPVQGQEPRLLSAFFGLDDALPARANLLCAQAEGKDGLPVVLSHTVEPEEIQPEDFRIVTRSGAEQTPLCATLRPAADPGEHRTVLLIGEFGNASDDPPAKARVVGDVTSDGTSGDPVNFRGAEIAVTPLESGPSMVLAEVVSEVPPGGRGSLCPEGTLQTLRVTWNGGVRRPGGEEVGDAERKLYRVTVEGAAGSSEDIPPAALAELGDNDNNHFLCLDTAARALSVAFPGGHLVDPNQDLNEQTEVPVTGSGTP